MSSPFKFVVGPDEREFTIHSALVAAQSPSLDALVNGHMKEASEQCVKWDETDEHTFVCFSQFAYTGDYSGTEQLIPIPRGEEVEDSVAFSTSKSRKKGRKLYADSDESEQAFASFWDRFKKLCPDSACDHATVCWSDDTEVLLSHAHIYCFADYHGIAALQTVALRKLHRVLVQLNEHDKSIGAIVELARYSYQHTRDQNDRLRLMINMYAACKAENLWESQDFRSLVETNSDFSVTFIGDMVRRLSFSP